MKFTFMGKYCCIFWMAQEAGVGVVSGFFAVCSTGKHRIRRKKKAAARTNLSVRLSPIYSKITGILLR